MEKKINSILLKVSGEYLASRGKVFCKKKIDKVVRMVIRLQEHYSAIYVVVGGGNIVRGRELSSFNFKNGLADTVGILSTIQNAKILKESFGALEVKSCIMAPFAADMLEIHTYNPGKAIEWAETKGYIVIFGGGLGLPGFTTDMTAINRAYAVGADIVVKITEVGGLYTADPKKDKTATLINALTHAQTISGAYKVMDDEAFAFAKNQNIPIKITDLVLRNLLPENIHDTRFGTLISTR